MLQHFVVEPIILFCLFVKTAALNSLRRIHTLNLSNNQIVSSEGLEEAITVQYVDLSHNYLQHFTDVSKLCLLTHLDLSCNNLLEVCAFIKKSYLISLACVEVYKGHANE